MNPTWPNNPFWIGEANWGPDGLFLERPPLQALAAHAADLALSAVVLGGPRRMGKTSLLRRLQRDWDEVSQETRICTVFEDVRNHTTGEPPSLQDPSKLWASLDAQLVRAGLLEPATEEVRDIGAIMTRWRARMMDKDSRLLYLLIDEVELLYLRDPRLLVDLLRCFRIPGNTQPAFLILSWGRWLGSPTSTAVTAALKDTPHEHLGPVSETYLKDKFAETFANLNVPLESDASDRLWMLSQGHPYYAMAIARRLFECRRDTGDRSTISAREITANVLNDAATAISNGLQHAWSQVSIAAHALSWGMARLAIRSQPDVETFDIEAALRGVPIASVLEYLRQHTTHRFDTLALESAAPGLHHNYVIEPINGSHNATCWRIRSPFLAAWLASHSFDSLDPDSRRVEEESGKTAADLLGEALIEAEAGNDEAAAALLRRARAVAPVHPQIMVTAARIARRRGELSEAAALLRTATMRGDPREIHRDLADVLEQQILMALAREDNPLSLWAEYRELTQMTPRRLDPAASQGIIDAFARQWRDQVEEGRIRDALATVRRIEREALGSGPTDILPNWRARFLDHYVTFMRTHSRSYEQLQRCLGVIICGLQPLTEVAPDGVETIFPSLPNPEQRLSSLPEPLQSLLRHLAPQASRFGDLSLDVQQLLERELERRHENQAPPEWRVTLDALAAAGDGKLGCLPRELDDQVLRSMMLRVPKKLEGELRLLLRTHLPSFAVRDVLADSSRAEHLVVLLREIDTDESTLLDPVIEAIEERVLKLEEASPEEAEAAFRVLPGLLHQLYSWKRHRSGRYLPADTVLDLAQMVLAAVRRGNDKESWLIVARQSAAAQGWRELVQTAARESTKGEARNLLEDLDLPLDLRILSGPDVDELSNDRDFDEASMRAAKHLLDPRFYQIDSVVHTGGVGPHHLVTRFKGGWRSNEGDQYHEAHIKLFRLPGDDTATREFLEALWSHERRVLFEIGSRRVGRSLAELRSSEIHTSHGYLVIITEPVGRVTLRDLLRSGRAAAWRSRQPTVLWREILGLMRGLQALHESHYMHRSLRPETIRVRYDSESSDSFRFKLVDFEWSIYLHAALADSEPRRRHLDYYYAPEVLIAELGTLSEADLPRGEAFASDLYSLGLLLFELLVRPLTALELGEFRDRRSYSVQAHSEFILQLRDEVLDARRDLSEDIQLLVLGLLRFEVINRVTTLRDAIEQATKFAFGAEGLQGKLNTERLPMVAALDPETEESIAAYICRYPGVTKRFATIDDTRTFIEEELRGARVYENATSGGARPLFIEGKSVNFTAMPFNIEGAVFKSLAYLWVAMPLDSPQGEPLVRLKAGVNVDNLRYHTNRAEHVSAGDAKWETLFSLVGDPDAVASDEQRKEQVLLHEALHLTAEAEEDQIEEQMVAYRVVSGPTRSRDGRFETLVIGPREDPSAPVPSGQHALRRAIAQQSQLEGPEFELARRRSVSDWVQDDLVWQAQEVDAEKDTVTMARYARSGSSEPPVEGWIRGRGVSGAQALMARRRRVLRRLVGDRHVLGSITRPVDAHQEIVAPEPQYFLNLDIDKQRIVRRMQTARPMLMVQGPPGTGKTTLAAEVVLQSLAASSSSRILVTAQGHDPLNNLLKTVADQLGTHGMQRGKEGRLRETLLVRLVPERRLSTTEELTGPGREIETRFNPARVGEELLDRSLRWKPDDDMPVAPELATAWHRFVEEQRRWSISDEMQRRIVNSANIVCATANDRGLEFALDGRPFDLLIYEEAGRALPLELLGPMTGASRWLIIGDSDQLPPHQAPELQRILARGLKADLDKDRTLGESVLTERRQKALGIIELFKHLWNSDAGRVLSDRLTLQYRMHPAISNCVSNTYYARKLKCADEPALRESRRHRIINPPEIAGRAIVWIDMPWVGDGTTSHLFEEEPASRGGYTNHSEIRAIQRFLGNPAIRLRRNAAYRRGDVAFLSPYRAQVERFDRVFATWEGFTGPLDDAAHTVDSFQGRQAEIVIVSVVRNNRLETPRAALGFLTESSRSVVMFSRAKSLLVVVGCADHFSNHPPAASPIRRFYDEVCRLEPRGDAKVIRATDLLSPACYKFLDDHWKNRERNRRGRLGEDGGKS